RPQMLQEVGLPERYAGIAEDRIRRRGVKKEIGERKAGKILGTAKAIAHAVREFDDDFPIVAAVERTGIEASNIIDRPLAPVLELGEAGLGIGHRRSLRAG